MGKQNNFARSLKIISKGQGWDPDEIVGGGRIDEILHPRESPFDNATHPIPAQAMDKTTDHPGGQDQWAHKFNTPDVSREKSNHTTNADPAPGIPGAGSRRRR